MPNDLSFLPFFITEDLYILPEDVYRAAGQGQPDTAPQVQATAAPEPDSTQTKVATPAVASAKKPAETTTGGAGKPYTNPKLIFGKNLKKLLILVEDQHNPVMERADGLLLKDILKAVDYTFDDVAIVNICHCQQDEDWKLVNNIPYNRLFSFGIKHPKLPATTALAPYELESSGDKKFLLTDSLAELRNDRNRKIALWNLLKRIFV